MMFKFCALMILLLLYCILAVFNGSVSENEKKENQTELSTFETKLDNKNKVQMRNYEAEDKMINKSIQKISNYSKSANKAKEKTKYNETFKSQGDNQNVKTKIDINIQNIENVIVILGDANEDKITEKITNYKENNKGNGYIHRTKEETSLKTYKNGDKEISEGSAGKKKSDPVNNENNQENDKKGKKAEKKSFFYKHNQDNDYYLSYLDNDLINKHDNDNVMKSKEKSEGLVKNIKSKEKSEGIVTEMKNLSNAYDADYGHKKSDTKKPEDSFFYRLKDVPETYDAMLLKNFER